MSSIGPTRISASGKCGFSGFMFLEPAFLLAIYYWLPSKPSETTAVEECGMKLKRLVSNVRLNLRLAKAGTCTNLMW